MPGTLPTIFISHVRTDRVFAESIKANLRQNGFHIQNGADQGQVLLVVLSSEAVQDIDILKEYRFQKGQGKRIIALEKELLLTIPGDLDQRIPFHKDYTQGLQELLRLLNGSNAPAAANPAVANQQAQRPSTHSGGGCGGLGALVVVIILGFFIYNQLFGPQAAAYLKGDPIDGINCDTLEQASIHYHAHLQLYVEGAQISIPVDVGRQSRTGCSYWLHTQPDAGDEGVIHVESPDNQTFTLHQFFDIWGQQLSATNLLGNQVDASNKLTVYVYTPTSQPTDSKDPFTVTPPSKLKPYTNDPTMITLKPHELIVLEYGLPIVAPPAWTFLASE